MPITLPTSIQGIVGDRVLCLGTSYDRTRFFLDIPRAAANNKRTRFAYNLIGGKVAGSYNLSSLLGNTVLAVELTYTTDLAKLIFTTNPTGSKVEKTIIYIVNRETSYLLQEDDFLILQEDDFGIYTAPQAGINTLLGAGQFCPTVI